MDRESRAGIWMILHMINLGALFFFFWLFLRPSRRDGYEGNGIMSDRDLGR